MANVWNIGNTTVRNPKRIENALNVFAEEGFSGNAAGSEKEKLLHKKLRERGVLEYENHPSEWNGRKWRAAFYQLGFISNKKYLINQKNIQVKSLFKQINTKHVIFPYQITPVGEKLIEASKLPEIEDIYSRQYICYEIANAIESNFPKGKMKPFILFLQVLDLLEKNNQPGLTKFETGLFLQKFQNHTDNLPKKITCQIIDYREEIKKAPNSDKRKQIKERYLGDLHKYTGINTNSVVKDYADTTFRYFFLSGLFTSLSGEIRIRPGKKEFVAKILESEPSFVFSEDPYRYLEYFYNNTYPLPTDNPEFALKEIHKLSSEIRDKSNPLLRAIKKINTDTDINHIQSIRHKLIEYNNWELETDFAQKQQSIEAINDIIKYLKVLNHESVPEKPEIDDKPAFLEWAVWRSFLAVNDIKNPVYKTRRFSIDHDFMPRNTAPGGGADLIFEFGTYVLVIEVTLTTSHRQMAVESEPVRRHTVKYRETYPNKDIYCLFIAPNVDNNVAEAFRIGIWYNEDKEEFVNIVPISLSEFIKTIEALKQKKFSNEQFKTLLDRCLVFRNVRAPQWKQIIAKEVQNWTANIVN